MGESRPETGTCSRKASRLGLWLWLGGMAAVAALLLWLSTLFPNALSDMDSANMIQLAAFLALASSGLLFIRQVHLKQGAIAILAWTGVIAILILGYVYQERLMQIARDVRSQLVPGYPVDIADHRMTISENDNGSYAVIGSVNGVTTHFVIDTGATDIVLDPADAAKLGIDLSALKFQTPYGTANGIGYGARYTVDRLAVGGIVLTDVPVSINNAPIGSSLLGMAFLRRLKGCSVEDRRMVLTW